MKENEEMNVNDLANMLCMSVSAKMEITMHHDEVTVSGGTAIDIVDLYIVIKALEAVGRRCMPMMKSADYLKVVIKKMVDLMDFTDEAEHKEDTP